MRYVLPIVSRGHPFNPNLQILVLAADFATGTTDYDISRSTPNMICENSTY
jgi:hypothetical protein